RGSPEVVESPGTARGEARFDFARPKLRTAIAVPLARDGIAAHVAVPSRKVLRGAIPARSGASHGPRRETRQPPVTHGATSIRTPSSTPKEECVSSGRGFRTTRTREAGATRRDCHLERTERERSFAKRRQCMSLRHCQISSWAAARSQSSTASNDARRGASELARYRRPNSCRKAHTLLLFE